MVNTTFAKLYLLSLIFGMQSNVTYTIFAPYLVLFTPRCFRFCDIFARSKFVQIHFFVQACIAQFHPT